ncbi:unnamed protein product, partial [Adineta steineri]
PSLCNTSCCPGFGTPCRACHDPTYGTVYCYQDTSNYGNLYGLISDCVSDYNSGDDGVHLSYGWYSCTSGVYSSGPGTPPPG